MNNSRKASYTIEVNHHEYLLLRDIGPYDIHPTITNDAEAVVANLAGQLGTRRLFYIDTDGRVDELLHNNKGEFMGFAPGPAAMQEC